MSAIVLLVPRLSVRVSDFLVMVLTMAEPSVMLTL